jgi:hypothetical protein
MLRVAKKERKNAVLESSLIFMIVAIASLVLLATQSSIFVSKISAKELVEKCHLSVSLASWRLDANNWVMDFNVLESPFSFDCETIFTRVTKDGIKQAGSNVKFKKKGNTDVDLDDAAPKLEKAILNNMKDCWYMYGEGKAKIHQTVKVDTEETACIVCSDIIVDQNIFGNDGIKLEDVYTYAKTTSMPGSDKTYLKYFLEGTTEPSVYPGQGGITDNSEVLLGKDDAHNQYSIVFAVANYPDKEMSSCIPTEINWGGRPLFGWGSQIYGNSGIVDCYVGGYNGKLTGTDAQVSCGSGDNNAITFGKVVDGGYDFDLLPSLDNGISFCTNIRHTYPATVRLVQTSKLGDCKRLY